MKHAAALALLGPCVILCGLIISADALAAGPPAPALEAAWTAWEKGDVAEAETLASAAADGDARRHLLFLCAFVTGHHNEALEHYRLIRASYPRFTELGQPVVDAYLHLGRYAEAERFAHAAGMDEPLCGELAQRAAHPLGVTLDRVAEIPFADHHLAGFFPAVEAQIEASPVLVHVDTGGTFLHMNLDRARELGIDLTPGREGRHGMRPVQTHRGIAATFRLGDVLLENVPVVALPSLTGGQDFIMLGTNILQQFLATLDYPAGRLILSPRRDAALREEHLAMLPRHRVQIPFHMWGDHYMFARGGLGERRDLNFFIDSGLISLRPDGRGGLRQAALWCTRAHLMEWGLDPAALRRWPFECPLPVSLGPLEQTDLLVLPRRSDPVESLGGVRIDGLLSHGFLRSYSWTIDFDEHQYTFASPTPAP